MRSTIKTFVILTILAVLVLSVLSLAKYYNVRLGIASGDSGKLTLTVPVPTSLTYTIFAWQVFCL